MFACFVESYAHPRIEVKKEHIFLILEADNGPVITETRAI
jgi:hypothetical protein